MTPQEQHEAILRTLNEGVKADPTAVHALQCISIPCNQELADHPHIVVSESQAQEGRYVLRVIGWLNGALNAAGIRNVASKFENGKFLGFCSYSPKEEPK